MRAILAIMLLAVALGLARGAEPSTGLLRGGGSALGTNSGSGTAPAPPRESVEAAQVGPAAGRTIRVPVGGDLQAALRAAAPGDQIALQAGASFEGPFKLPRKSGAGWIVVKTDAPERALPPPGTRIDPSRAPAMPKLVAASDSVIVAEEGAHHYRFVGLEIRPKEGAFLVNLVLLGASERTLEALPHHIVFDRCWLHGDPKRGARRGIAMNSRNTAVVDSWLSDFKEAGADSQAIASWNGDGPFAIMNSHLEAAGENVMFGGADPAIPDLVPSDIEILRNHFTKPLSWKPGEPGFEGTAWTVKNLFELKNARRVRVKGNLFENNWAAAQGGFAILFTVRNQDGGAPWSVVEDVTFANNLVRHAASGVNILGRDDVGGTSEQTRRILISGNLFYDVGGARWGGKGILVQILNGTADVIIEHNTAFQTGSIIMAEGAAHTGFVFRDNIAPHNEYGIAGTGAGTGRPALAQYFPGSVVRGNVIVGGRAGLYPAGNFFPSSADSAGLVPFDRGGWRLAASSPLRGKGTDGRDPGADPEAILSALGEPRLPS